MWEDPIVAEVRRVRDELSKRFNYDLKAIVADIRSRQASLGNKLVLQPKRTEIVKSDENNVQENAAIGG